MVGHTMQVKALFILQSFVAVVLVFGYKTQITVVVVRNIPGRHTDHPF